MTKTNENNEPQKLEEVRLESILRRKSKFKSSPLRFSYQSFSQRITGSKCSSLKSSPMSDFDGFLPSDGSPSTESSLGESPLLERISSSNVKLLMEQKQR